MWTGDSFRCLILKVVASPSPLAVLLLTYSFSPPFLSGSVTPILCLLVLSKLRHSGLPCWLWGRCLWLLERVVMCAMEDSWSIFGGVCSLVLGKACCCFPRHSLMYHLASFSKVHPLGDWFQKRLWVPESMNVQVPCKEHTVFAESQYTLAITGYVSHLVQCKHCTRNKE